jgi:multidrug efflux pump subunit AcrB
VTASIGLAGRVAGAFLHSKLTPLLIAASTALGLFAVAALPREEEPQIVVPMIDVFVDLPGATPTEVEQRLTRPLERALWEIAGVEYVYSTSSPGQSTIIVRFAVGDSRRGRDPRARAADRTARVDGRSSAPRRVCSARQGALDR